MARGLALAVVAIADCLGASASGCQQHRDAPSHAGPQLQQPSHQVTGIEMLAQQQTVTHFGKLVMGIVCLHTVELKSCCCSDKDNFLSSDEI